MCSQFAPPSLNFSGCSVNVYNGPVMTSGSFHRSSMYNFGLSAGDLENFDKFLVQTVNPCCKLLF